jgi:Arc/MetJ-type ribon-helix-helix transcriptional regulator
MAQFVTRVDGRLASLVDQLVEEGVVESRSDAVRRGLQVLVERHRRGGVAREIVRGYRDFPQGEDEVGWADAATIGMIGDEPW